MTIKRFEPYNTDRSIKYIIKEDKLGQFVLYSDYYLLNKEYNQLKKEYLAIVKLYEDIKSSHRSPPDHDIIP
jgi:hypothetical protein